jgi:hypothetical protein
MPIYVDDIIFGSYLGKLVSFELLEMCRRKSPKRERLKQKCALGPSVLVIKCSTHHLEITIFI